MDDEPRQANPDIRQDSLLHKTWARLAIASVIVLLAIVLIYYLLRLGLRWYLSPTSKLSITERKDLVQGLASFGQALAVGLTGVAGFIGLAFTWRNLRQTRENTERTLELTEQGQITERFTRAIDQLGATDDKGKKKLEIRLGGIYALERIARESEEDHWPIMEVLTAYVRQHTHWRPEEGQQGEEDAAIEKPKEDSGGSSGKAESTEGSALDPDIQAILTVLRRRTRYFGHGELGQINLSRTDLRAANLVETHLERADLRRAHLERARLKSAHLEEAQLINANLEQANLEKAHLEGANLQSAHMQRSILREAHLEKAILPHVHLEKAGLYKAHLEGAQLQGAHLQGAFLREAHLKGTRLRLADLSGADLSGADLTGAEVTKKQLDTARKLEGATMPDGSKRP